METVTVYHPELPEGMILNKSDFDPAVHKTLGEKEAETMKAWHEAAKFNDPDADKRKADANRGVIPSPNLHNGRHASGTFLEPTPSDVRYPDMDETEYENNHGAFSGKSAAQMRKTLELPDMPGGLRPDKHLIRSAKDKADKEFSSEMSPAEIYATPEEKADAAKSGLSDMSSGDDSTGMHVGKGPAGRWYVKEGKERVSEPFKSEEEANKALQKLKDENKAVDEPAKTDVNSAPIA